MRAFVGVPIPPEPALTTLLAALDALDADLKVVAPHQLHVTLAFLGDIPEDAALAPALDQAVVGVPKFDLALQNVGAFPNARRPRVIWAGVHDPARLQQLASRVRDALRQAGWPGDDKEFQAHVTLARVKSHRGEAAVTAFLRDHARDELPTLPVGVVRLYWSQLSPAGPSYAVIHESALEA